MRLEKELQINQLDLQKLKLTASADRLKELSPSAELTLQTQLAEAESSFAAKQNEMADVTAQLQDHREVLAALQQVLSFQLLLLLQLDLSCRAPPHTVMLCKLYISTNLSHGL
jgi:autotransporter translocation and assembly factor TamB